MSELIPFESIEDFPMEAHYYRSIGREDVFSIEAITDTGIAEIVGHPQCVIKPWDSLAEDSEYYLNGEWHPFRKKG